MITLVLGGARSGKSAFAEELARAREDVTYIATADAGDAEMEARINMHRSRRPAAWRTWEGNPAALPEEIGRLGGAGGTLLLDCLTMYLTRRFLAAPESEAEEESAWFAAEREILAALERLFANFADASRKGGGAHLIAVSNEVGFGLVPPYRLGRRFRDMQGRANQIAARHADAVALVVAGLPLWVKGKAGPGA